ncbi:MAG: hypothetical protein ACKVOK_16945 [Flavobacteriales bacterium]
MKPFLFFALVLAALITQCSADESSDGLKRISSNSNESNAWTALKINYDSLKQANASKKAAWKLELDKTPLNKTDSFFEAKGNQVHMFFVDSVFPCWYGTVWDFNGYTDKPGEGLIACGYFVSTPLKHMGFNLNRYKVAQQYSHSIVNTLCTDIHDIQGYDKVLGHLKKSRNGLYIVGLDNHVGYISVEKGGVFFIHSSYVEPGCVLRENVESSAVFQYSRRFVIGNFSGNAAILRKWLKNQAIQIVA